MIFGFGGVIVTMIVFCGFLCMPSGGGPEANSELSSSIYVFFFTFVIVWILFCCATSIQIWKRHGVNYEFLLKSILTTECSTCNSTRWLSYFYLSGCFASYGKSSKLKYPPSFITATLLSPCAASCSLPRCASSLSLFCTPKQDGN